MLFSLLLLPLRPSLPSFLSPQICRGARKVTTIWRLGYENGGVSLRGLGRANGMAFFFSSSVAAAPRRTYTLSLACFVCVKPHQMATSIYGLFLAASK